MKGSYSMAAGKVAKATEVARTDSALAVMWLGDHLLRAVKEFLFSCASLTLDRAGTSPMGRPRCCI